MHSIVLVSFSRAITKQWINIVFNIGLNQGNIYTAGLKQGIVLRVKSIIGYCRETCVDVGHK